MPHACLQYEHFPHSNNPFVNSDGGSDALPQEDDYDEEDKKPNGGSDALPQEDDYDEDPDREKKANVTSEEEPVEMGGQLEFTHHIYEEYLPSLPRESKPPIILHTVPHYQISNFYSLSRHHHPHRTVVAAGR